MRTGQPIDCRGGDHNETGKTIRLENSSSYTIHSVIKFVGANYGIGLAYEYGDYTGKLRANDFILSDRGIYVSLTLDHSKANSAKEAALDGIDSISIHLLSTSVRYDIKPQ